MHPRQIPFLRLFLPWLAGIAAGTKSGICIPGAEYGLGVGLFVLLFLAPRRYAYRFRWVYGSCAFALVFGMGYVHAYRHDERRQKAHVSHVCSDAAVFTGIVYDAPSTGAKVKVPLRVEAAGNTADSLQACAGNVLLFLPLTPEAERLRYGDRLWVKAPIRATEPLRNPHAFDYGQYLHFQNIHFQAFVKEGDFGVVSAGHGHFLWRAAYRWREQLLAVLREHFPGKDEYAVASALLVGYKGDLSEELRTTYAETGSMHALAVSGTHVGLMYAAFLFVLQRIPWRGNARRWGETSLVLVGIWAFTLLTGATASVMRASVMFTCYLLGKAIRRTASIWNILGASAFLLLWLNPYFLFDAGFQLSYFAVAGIVTFYPIFQKAWPSPHKWAETGWSILLIGIAAQLGTLPLSLYYFHQFPVYFWLAGWVVVIGGAVFLWSGSVLVLLSATVPFLAEWLGWLLYHLLWGMNRLMQGIQQLPGSVVSGVWISIRETFVLYLFIVLFTGAIQLRHARMLLASLAVLAVLGFCRLGRQLEQHRQRQVVLYHQNRHFLFDFFDGTHHYAWVDSLDGRRERFSAQANRWAHGVRAETRVSPPVESPFRSRNLFVCPPFVQFHGLRMVVLDRWDRAARSHAPPVPVDVLVLRNNTKTRLADCQEQFAFLLVVFDATNAPWRVERWKAECRDLGLPFHDVRTDGAWQMDVAKIGAGGYRANRRE